MEPKEIEALLKQWAGIMQNLERALSEMTSVFGGTYDCANAQAILDMVIEYTNLVSEKVGDSGEWLNYFRNECELGQTPKEVTFCDGTSILLDSVDALIEIILAQ